MKKTLVVHDVDNLVILECSDNVILSLLTQERQVYTEIMNYFIKKDGLQSAINSTFLKKTLKGKK